VKLLLDEHLPPRLAEVLRGRGLDVTAVAERADWRGRPDADVLALAVAEQRAIVTRDAADFLALVAGDPTCPVDLFLVPGRPFPATADGVGRLAAALEAAIDQAVQRPAGGRIIWLRPA
jgi:hypothetical protein